MCVPRAKVEGGIDDNEEKWIRATGAYRVSSAFKSGVGLCVGEEIEAFIVFEIFHPWCNIRISVVDTL